MIHLPRYSLTCLLQISFLPFPQSALHPLFTNWQSPQFADDICNFSSSEDGKRASIEFALQYCSANRLKVNIQKSCYTVFNDSKGNRSDIVIRNQALKYDPQPCYLGICLSNAKIDLNSIMLRKASKASFALSTMLTPTTSATLINKLFSQLIEPILLCSRAVDPICPP